MAFFVLWVSNPPFQSATSDRQVRQTSSFIRSIMPRSCPMSASVSPSPAPPTTLSINSNSAAQLVNINRRSPPDTVAARKSPGVVAPMIVNCSSARRHNSGHNDASRAAGATNRTAAGRSNGSHLEIPVRLAPGQCRPITWLLISTRTAPSSSYPARPGRSPSPPISSAAHLRQGNRPPSLPPAAYSPTHCAPPPIGTEYAPASLRPRLQLGRCDLGALRLERVVSVDIMKDFSYVSGVKLFRRNRGSKKRAGIRHPNAPRTRAFWGCILL